MVIKMKKMTFITIIVSLFFFASCSEDNPVESGSGLYVIIAFLYAGEQVDNIQITETLPLGSTDTVAPPITNAQVVLKREGDSFPLIPLNDKPGYYTYQGNDLQISSGDNYRIEVNFNNIFSYGETIVPDKPKNVSIMDSVLGVPELSMLDFRNLNLEDYSILISWDNPDASLYYVVIENLETDPETIFSDLPEGMLRRSFISSPAKISEYIISPMNITYLGRHRAIVYKVNQEYADLYESREQDSRNLNEPLSNIYGALGVFSAFASDTVYFDVVRE